MKKLALAVVSLWLAFAAPALAVNVNIDGLPAATSVVGTDLLECEQSGTNNKCTSAQEAAYIYGLMSADATASGTGVLTFKTVNANVGSFGSATQCTAITVNAKGLITAASAATCTPAVGSITGLATGIATWLATPTSANLAAALTDETGSGATVFGTAPTIASLNATVAATLAYITGSTQCLHVNSSGAVTGTGSDCGSGSTTITAGTTPTSGITSGHFLGSLSNLVVDQTAVTSVSAGCGTSTGGSAITTTGTVSASITRRANTATTDTLISTDCGNIVSESNAASIAVAIAQAGTTGFATGTYFWVCNINVGVVTITPTTSTIGGASTLVINAGTAAHPNCTGFQSDGTNYNLMDAVWGSGVIAAAANALSSAGGLASTIASGTAVLGTSAIGSGACATVVTVTATNVATTDVVSFGYNGDPTAVTGYGSSATGAVLTIYPYPTSGNVNVKVCNSSPGSITPSAMTLNWRVWR